MKIIHSCTSSSFSGLEGYVLELAGWQYAQGRDVELFCREGSELENRARARGIPVWTIGAKDRPGLRLWGKLSRQWRARLGAGEVVLHMHAGGESRTHLPLLLRRPRRLAKAVLHYHIWINHKKTDPLHRVLFYGIDEVWTSSESARAHLATLLPVDRLRIRVVPYGRDVRRLTQAPVREWREEFRKKLGLEEGDVLGLAVSRIEPIKGIGELVEAFEKVSAELPRAHLALIGNASPSDASAARLSEEIRARHEKMSEDRRSRLHLLGFVSPCEPYMAAADFYVLPTYEECFSLAMLDAAILGLPIIGTNAGGTPSLVRPDETGELVPPRDATALAEAMRAFYQDSERLRRMGERASTLGREYAQDAIFAKILDWYSALPPSVRPTT